LLDVVRFEATYVVGTSMPSAVLGITLGPKLQGPLVETVSCCLQATTRTKVEPKGEGSDLELDWQPVKVGRASEEGLITVASDLARELACRIDPVRYPDQGKEHEDSAR
jgi:hypothetical protein